ncbi:MAG: beta strand repeat-containing protein [Burkholderiaceae bacterium]
MTVNLATNTVSGGDAAGDTISNFQNVIGGSGADLLIGDDGANWLGGDGGNDTIRGGLGADTIDGGTGFNTADYSTSSAGVTINLQSGTGTGGDAQGDQPGNIRGLIGSDYTDYFTGTTSADSLSGCAGNDTMIGAAGADTLVGGAGVDTVDYSASILAVTISLATGTGSGGDAAGDSLSEIENIVATDGNDLLTGSTADNALYGGLGTDTIEGGAGADTLDGGTGANTLSYAASSAGVTVDIAANTASGGDAAGDVISSFQHLVGSAHGDSLTGDSLANTMQAGGGADLVWGGGGADTIDGEAGNDTINGGAGADIIDGGSGTNTVDYTGSTKVYVDVSNIAAGTGSFGDANGDSLVNIQNVTGSAGDDTLIGGSDANVLSGAGGTDTIEGGGGADTLSGGAGADRLIIDGSSLLLAGVSIDGGTEQDTLEIAASSGSGFSLSDLVAAITNVETLDFTQSSIAATVEFDAAGINAITGGSGTLAVSKDGNDSISIAAGSEYTSSTVGATTTYVFYDSPAHTTEIAQLVVTG